MSNNGSSSLCVVLAVDDEQAVLQLVTTIFTRAGFEVVGAANADEALAVFNSRPDVAVLFTDIDMPGMRGTTLASIVRERWPEVKIMLASGKPVDPDELPEGADYISKPFRPSTLAPKLEAIKAAVQGSGERLEGSPEA